MNSIRCYQKFVWFLFGAVLVTIFGAANPAGVRPGYLGLNRDGRGRCRPSRE